MILFTRRLFLGCAGALPVAGCATEPPSPRGQTLPVSLVDAFEGPSRGVGVFRAPLAGIERRFTARLDGRLRGDTLTVVEDFRYDDGQQDRLTWVFTRTGPQSWTGRREDTVGPATVSEDGREIRLDYTADFRSTSGVTRLGFSDVIYRPSAGVIVNDAIVTRWGLPVGTVRFELTR